MRLLIPLALLAFILAGCGQSGTASNNAQLGPETSVTYDQPSETEQGSVTLKELSEKAGINMISGTEGATGKHFVRNDGGTKDEVTFTTGKSLAEVDEFYKKQGFTTKIKGKVGDATGKTKTDAFVIVVFKEKDKGSEVTIRALVYPVKK